MYTCQDTNLQKRWDDTIKVTISRSLSFEWELAWFDGKLRSKLLEPSVNFSNDPITSLLPFSLKWKNASGWSFSKNEFSKIEQKLESNPVLS